MTINWDRIRTFGADLARLYAGRHAPGAVSITGDYAVTECRERGGEEEAAAMHHVVEIVRTAVGEEWEQIELRAAAQRLVAYAHSGGSGCGISARQCEAGADRMLAGPVQHE